MTNEIKFRNRDEILTLWIEKTTDDGYFIGWCPELENTMIVDIHNVVTDDPGNKQIAGKLLESNPDTEKEGFEPSFEANPHQQRVGTHNAGVAPGEEVA